MKVGLFLFAQLQSTWLFFRDILSFLKICLEFMKKNNTFVALFLKYFNMKKLFLSLALLTCCTSFACAQFFATFQYVPQAGAVYCFIYNQTAYFAQVELVAEDNYEHTHAWNANIYGGTNVAIGPAQGWTWEPGETITVNYMTAMGLQSLSWRYTPNGYNPSFRGTYNDQYKGKLCSNRFNGHYCSCPGFISKHKDPAICANCGCHATKHTRTK